MSKQKNALQEVPALYWNMISGAGDEKAKTAKQTTTNTSTTPECQVKVKTDNSQNVRVIGECTYPDGKTIEVSGGHNFRTGYTEAEILLRWRR